MSTAIAEIDNWGTSTKKSKNETSDAGLLQKLVASSRIFPELVRDWPDCCHQKKYDMLQAALRFLLMAYMDEIHNLLLSKFFHDIASPINALGLLLEMLKDRTPTEDIQMAQQCCDSISNFLRLYRILLPAQECTSKKFSDAGGAEIFKQVEDYLQKTSKKDGFSFENHVPARQISDSAGKIILCVFTLLRGSMHPLRSFVISPKNGEGIELAATSQQITNTREFATVTAFFDNITRGLDVPNGAEYKSNALHLFLKQLLLEGLWAVSLLHNKNSVSLVLTRSSEPLNLR